MALSVFALVLLGALLHAVWNAIIKNAGDKLQSTILVAGTAGVLAAIFLPFLPLPAAASWPYLAASICCQVTYYALVARTYSATDMSQAYPLMRGAAPLLVAAASVVFIGETLSPPAWMGLALICFGIMGLAASARGRSNARGVRLALANAAVIAAYTFIDGLGVRRSLAPVSYTLWLFALTAVPLLAWALVKTRAAFLHQLRAQFYPSLIGGFGNLASYGVALWAMTLAPIALVAALRETSIVFATAIAALVLKERVSTLRIAMSALIATGAVALRLA